MKIVVQKYGGSSVADLDRMGRVADRVARTRAEGCAVVVVVSAMGRTTDQLLNLAREVSPDPDRRELDMLISTGERITMALLALALRERGVPARSLTGSQSGIITDESHADARVVEVRAERVRTLLEAGEVVIVAGFQGVSRLREVTTLGRGGSDTTAVVLAAALEAEHCEICSDVDGVWSADPRVVPDARRIDEMSVDEALALSRGGAKVLFEDAVRYAQSQGINLVASSAFGPGSGTRIRAGVRLADGVRAVTGDAQLVRVCVSSPEGWTAIERSGGRVRSRIGDVGVVDIRNAHGGLAGLPGLTSPMPMGRLTAVGTGIGERSATLQAGLDALATAGIDVEDCAASGDVCVWDVAPDAVATATRILHEALVTG